jgi:hypothetical protein
MPAGASVIPNVIRAIIATSFVARVPNKNIELRDFLQVSILYSSLFNWQLFMLPVLNSSQLGPSQPKI